MDNKKFRSFSLDIACWHDGNVTYSKIGFERYVGCGLGIRETLAEAKASIAEKMLGHLRHYERITCVLCEEKHLDYVPVKAFEVYRPEIALGLPPKRLRPSKEEEARILQPYRKICDS